MKVLGIDTGAAAGSAAIMQDDVLVSEVLLTSRRTHSGRIMKAIDMVLSMAELKPSDLDGFAVAIGPGSFTGLRIGISTVKGLAFSAEKPVASVTTLDALAGQFPCSHALICPILNAGKGDVYTASYRADKSGSVRRTGDYTVISPLDLTDRISEPCLFAGDGVKTYSSVIKENLGSLALFPPPFLNSIRASAVACIGMKRLRKHEADDLKNIVPFYIRQSDAEIIRNGN